MVDFFFVLCRIPLTLLGTIALSVAAGLVFLLEVPAAFVSFPVCAATTSRQWLRENWPGTFPATLRWFFSDAEGREEYETKTVSTWFGLGSEEVKVLKAWEPRGGLRLISDMWEWALAQE